MANLLCDMDGTVCEDIPNEEANRFADAEPYEGAAAFFNGLIAGGTTVTFFTARQEKDRRVTTEWLDRHGFQYRGLIMDKPRGGDYIWVDNLRVTGVLYAGGGRWGDADCEAVLRAIRDLADT